MGLQARYVNGAVALLAIGAVMVVVLGGSAQSEAGQFAQVLRQERDHRRDESVRLGTRRAYRHS